jgi:hypothetical protein
MILKCLYSFIRGRNKFEMTSKLKFYVEQSTNATLHDKHDHQYGRNIKSLKIRCCFVVVFYCIYWDVLNICPFPLPHFASIFFAYLWSFRWPNDIVTLPRYFSFRLSHLNIPTGPPQTNWTRIFSERSLFYLERILKMTNVPINTVKNNNKAAPYFERFNIPTVLMVMFIV